MSLNKNEQKIYELLKSRELYRNEKGIFTMCPQKLLIRLSGKSERTVRDISKNLEKKGYIHRELLQEENIMLYYFLNEDFSGRAVYDRYENCRPSTVCTEKIAAPPQSVLENCRPSTICTGKIAPPPQSVVKNDPPSTVCTEKMTPPPQSVVKNDPPSTVCTGKIAAPPQSVLENCRPSTVCTAITQSHKKTIMPHIAMSDVIAERMFYTMPDSPASHFFIDILSAGMNIAELPARKKQINHSTKYSVMQKGNKRLLAMENSSGNIAVEIEDINKLLKTGMRFFILSMIKANEQILHGGKISREYITFSLQELVDKGMYSSIRSARRGFLTARDALTSLKVRGQIQKGRKKTSIDDLSVLFIRGRIENNQCYLYMNPYVDWNFLAQYFTKIPKYFFGLSDNAAKLLYYIFYLARQNTRNIAGKGCFSIKFRAIHNLLNLPNEKGNLKPQETIKTPIEKAIEEIETAHGKMYGNQEFSMLPVYDEKMKIAEYLDEGYLKISLKGTFATDFIEQNSKKEQKTIQSEKRKAKILEKAISINTAKAMENEKTEKEKKQLNPKE